MNDKWLDIALPKGRLGEQAYTVLEKAGYECPEIMQAGRKLIFENPERFVRYFWVKPSDVAVYVERGSADLGIVGSDILREYEPDVYELADLGIGRCGMYVAGPSEPRRVGEAALRVATKFPATARRHFSAKGREIDVIRLNGSIELAPLLGLSDVIVDIVETGRTLFENGLVTYDLVEPISARLIANRVSYKFSYNRVAALCASLEAQRAEEEHDKDL